MKKHELIFILKSYFVWIFGLLIILFFAIKFVPVQKAFLGGGLGNYLSNPYFWSWSNFDGVHYLALAQNGYQPLTYFFFPTYPLIIHTIGNLFGGNLWSLNLSGILISNISFFVALIGLWKLFRLDFDEKITKITIFFLLVSATSFYFSAVYTESLFLALTVWSFYFARTKHWFWASLLGGFASVTRIIGVILLPVLLIEYFGIKLSLKQPRLKMSKNILWLLFIPATLLAYMYYLWIKTGDPLNFLNTISIFGAQRSSHIILLPQVFYRYVFKVLPNLNYSVFVTIFTPLLEIFFGTVFTIISVISFFKLRFSYATYLTLGFLIPTFSGSFSSLPRYIAVLFPAFLLFAMQGAKSKAFLLAFSLISAILLVISFSLFARGYWIS